MYRTHQNIDQHSYTPTHCFLSFLFCHSLLWNNLTISFYNILTAILDGPSFVHGLQDGSERGLLVGGVAVAALHLLQRRHRQRRPAPGNAGSAAIVFQLEIKKKKFPRRRPTATLLLRIWICLKHRLGIFWIEKRLIFVSLARKLIGLSLPCVLHSF